MKEPSNRMDLLAGLLGLIIALVMLNWAASIIHLPWTLNISGAKDALLGASSASTQQLNSVKAIPQTNSAHEASTYGNLLGIGTSLLPKLLLLLLFAWILLGIIVWYRKTSTHTTQSVRDFLVFRWPQMSLGYVFSRPELIQDAWNRHVLSRSEVSVSGASSQFGNPQTLHRIEQILFAAMKGSDFKVEDAIGHGQDTRTMIRTNVVATWEDHGWRIQLQWPHGFQLDIYTKWREWGPNMAPIALRHYGFPALKGHVDEYGFLHITLDQPETEFSKQPKADAFFKTEEKEITESISATQECSANNEGPLREGGPPLSLLTLGKGAVGRPNEGKIVSKALEDALTAFQLSGTVHLRGIGPSLIQLAIIPQRGLSPKKIISRADDLRMAGKGSLPGLTLEGTDTEIRALVTRKTREIVALRDLLTVGPPENSNEKLSLWCFL